MEANRVFGARHPRHRRLEARIRFRIARARYTLPVSAHVIAVETGRAQRSAPIDSVAGVRYRIAARRGAPFVGGAMVIRQAKTHRPIAGQDAGADRIGRGRIHLGAPEQRADEQGDPYSAHSPPSHVPFSPHALPSGSAAPVCTSTQFPKVTSQIQSENTVPGSEDSPIPTPS